MKTNDIAYLILVAPLVIWAQPNVAIEEEIDLTDVIIIEDASVEPMVTSPVDSAVSETVTEAVVSTEQIAPDPVVEVDESEAVRLADEAVEFVEVPDEPIEGAVLDSDSSEGEEVSLAANALPLDTEVVLELPQQSIESEGATITAEETISVDFPDEDVRVILFNVADLFDLNLVVPDTLQGRTSIKLHQITWRDVFDVVLEPLGFAYVEDRNIIKVKSIEDIAAEPVTTTVIAVQYARADDIINSIKPLVNADSGGKIVSDSRKNLLIVTERPSRIQSIRNLVDEIDKATDQVMIETKFVEVFDEDVENIGVNWASLDSYSVSAGPWNRVYSRESGSLGGTVTNPINAGTTSRIDTAVFNADQFRLVLSALETLNDTKLVTNPTVVVMNKREANFEVGRDYPIRDITFNQETGTYEAGGVEEKFIGINLKVTPEVLGGNIHLNVDPVVSALDGTVESFGAIDPIIARRSVKTEVIIKDGHTLALGGLADEQVNDTETKVPLLGSLPGVGRLFRSNSDTTGKRNLIVFITAKTLNPEGTSYKEILDPRMLNRMGLVDSEVPGYFFRDGDKRMSDQEHELFSELEELRQEAQRAEKIAALQAQIDALRRPADRVVQEN